MQNLLTSHIHWNCYQLYPLIDPSKLSQECLKVWNILWHYSSFSHNFLSIQTFFYLPFFSLILLLKLSQTFPPINISTFRDFTVYAQTIQILPNSFLIISQAVWKITPFNLFSKPLYFTCFSLKLDIWKSIDFNLETYLTSGDIYKEFQKQSVTKTHSVGSNYNAKPPYSKLSQTIRWYCLEILCWRINQSNWPIEFQCHNSRTRLFPDMQLLHKVTRLLAFSNSREKSANQWPGFLSRTPNTWFLTIKTCHDLHKRATPLPPIYIYIFQKNKNNPMN